MTPYNIACLPVDETFAKACVDYAQAQFHGLSDAYLLDGATALPHVTLCQFDADGDAWQDVWERVKVPAAPRTDLAFVSTYFLEGDGIHKGYVWTGLAARRTAALVEMQAHAIRAVTSCGLKPLTAGGESYFPHLTMARLKRPSEGTPLVPALSWPARAIRAKPVPFILTLGLSDENGVYRKALRGA